MLSTVSKSITDELSSFQSVRSSFCLEVGQKVGIAVIFTEQLRPNANTVAGCDDEEKKIKPATLKKIYGEPDLVNVYTGASAYVGESHIEYDINAFTSCSGAIVFLLDQDQPDSVQPCDHDKAVAVLGGAHLFLNNRNLGFKLQGNLPHVGAD